MSLFGYHGLYDEEKKNGQKFEINVECKLKNSSKNNHIEESIDYVLVMDLIHETFNNKRYKLIETLAHDICAAILDFERILKVEVSIKKPEAPIDYDIESVEVVCSKKK